MKITSSQLLKVANAASLIARLKRERELVEASSFDANCVRVPITEAMIQAEIDKQIHQAESLIREAGFEVTHDDAKEAVFPWGAR